MTGAASAAPAPADAAPPAPRRGPTSEQAASEQLAAATPTPHVVEESAAERGAQSKIYPSARSNHGLICS